MDRDTTYHSTKRLGPQTSINYSSRRWYPLVLLLVIIISFCLTYIAYPSLLTINLVDDYLDSYANNKIAIVVLGGGLLPNGDVPPHTQLRIDEAVNIYHSLHAASGAGSATAPSLPIDIITLSGGTPHKPNPVDNHGFPIWESSAAAKKLLEKNIPIENVLEESSSLDTVGNAYFLRTVHIQPGGYKELYIITNNWHMDRTKAIFDHVFSLPATSSKSTSHKTNPVKLNYITVAAGLDSATLLSRESREQASLRVFESTTKQEFRDLRSMHDWLFTKHSAYSSTRFVKPRVEIDPQVLKTY